MQTMTDQGFQNEKKISKGLILVVACIAQFMVVLDLSIVNVALPSMKLSLGFTAVDLQWVLNAYTISFAGLLLLGGRLADIFGRRRVFIFGLLLFTGASLLGALSVNQWQVILARVLQGIGAAVVSPSTLTIITTTFSEGKERAKALGTWSAVAGAGGAAGALFGGILTQYLGWRWTFLINVPLGAGEIVLTFLFLTELKRQQGTRKLDIIGSALITMGLTTLVLGLVQSGNLGWTNSETLGIFGIAAVLILVFIYFEARVAKSPIIPLSLFRSRALSVANASMFMVGGAIFASWYFMSLFMQDVLGYTPLQAGIAFVPQTLAIVVGAQISSRIVTRVGSRPLAVVGPLFTAVGLLLLAGITPQSTYIGTIFLPSVLITLGMGLSFTPLALSATAGVAKNSAGLASGVLNTARQVGGAIGLAGLSSLAVSVSSSRYLFLTRHTHVSGGAASLIAASHGYGVAMQISALIALAASAIALFLPSTGVKPDQALAQNGDVEAALGLEGV